jgi:hypothetical protein
VFTRKSELHGRLTPGCALLDCNHGLKLLSATKTIIHAAADVARRDLRSVLDWLEKAALHFDPPQAPPGAAPADAAKPVSQ